MDIVERYYFDFGYNEKTFDYLCDAYENGSLNSIVFKRVNHVLKNETAEVVQEEVEKLYINLVDIFDSMS